MNLWKRFTKRAGQMGSRPSSRRGSSFRPQVEGLEQRALLACMAPAASLGVLTVTGDNNPEQISITEQGGNIRVTCDNVLVRSEPTGNVFHIVVNANGGDDTITIHGTIPQSVIDVVVDGGTETNTFNANGSSARNERIIVHNNQVAMERAAPVTYSNIQFLNVNANDLYNRIDIESTAATTTINAGSWEDHINITPAGRMMDAIGGSLTINGQGGSDRLVLHDQNNGYNDNFIVSAPSQSGSVSRPYMATIQFTSIDALALYAGGGVNTIDITSATNGPRVFVDAGPANDTVNGGAGHDILLGGDGGDRLNGFGGRDLMIGGLGKDYLYGGDEDDILIGGTTQNLDLNAFLAIMQEWSRSDLTGETGYNQRITNIRNGASGNSAAKLNSTTVIPDTYQDRLYGEGGLDWFFARNAPVTYPPGTLLLDPVLAYDTPLQFMVQPLFGPREVVE